MMIMQAKKISILMIKVDNCFLFLVKEFTIIRNRKMLSVFSLCFSVNLLAFYYKYHSQIGYTSHYLFSRRYSDGLPAEVCKVFWKHVSTFLIPCLNKSHQKGKLQPRTKPVETHYKNTYFLHSP